VTLSETFDLLDASPDEKALAEADRFDSIEIDAEPIEDDRPEPILAAAAPFFVEFDELPELDPERAGLIWELPPASPRAIELRSPLTSLAFHLLPLLGLILWPLMMVEPPTPIPVQLVFEQPPPPPPPPPPPQPQPEPPKPPQLERPPRGPLSSVDQGVVKQMQLGRTADPVKQPSAGQTQQNPTDTQTATTASPSPPLPLPKPAPPKDEQALHPPKPSGAHVDRREDTPHEAPHSARYPGYAANRDEYLAYLVTLTRQHIDLLPLSMVGDRHGETVISVVVYDNGTIGPIGVIRSSGYEDIDHRIEQMVAAVHRFPPLPQWYQGNAVQLELTLKFPEALEHSQ
jgi:protein TonB